MTISEPTASGLPIQWVEETDSTQNEILRHLHSYDNLSVVAAEHQTSGRGQRGNTWLAAKGMNLTFSLLLRFGEGGLAPLKATDQFGITRAATLGVALYLESAGIPCAVKWPNDIYVRGRKICGMLIENVLESAMVRFSVVGIGLNVNQTDFPAQLVNPTSMAMQTRGRYDTHSELEKLYLYLREAFSGPLLRPGAASEQTYHKRLYRLGRFHEYVRCSDGSVFEGKIVGVSPRGMLRIENKKGELEEFAFKEISYII